MMSEIMKRMSGEELLLLRILGDESARAGIEAELDHRAMAGALRRYRTEQYWAGRNFAARHSARLAA